MIGSILKGIVKLVVGKSAAKAGLDPGRSKTIIDIADDVINKDDDIQREIRDFILAFEGQYSELKTKAEGIIRTMLRPFLTLFFCVNAVIMIYVGVKPLPDLMFWATITLIGSWTWTKGTRDFKKFVKKKK